MVFNSYVFIFLFLPIVLIGYFLLNKINVLVGKIFLAVASAFFFVYGGWQSAIVFAISILINIFLCILIKRKVENKKAILVIDIIFNVAILFIFKYFNFFVGSIGSIVGQDFTLKNLILPLGISFFTFQQIMYVVNVYHDEIEKINVLDYLLYILYFPKVLMGPLTEPKEFIEQLNNVELKKVNWTNIANGIKVFSFGLFKKLIIADTFAGAVNWAFSNVYTLSSLDCILITLFYTFEIYFDFSGYSDMAVGISKMLNIQLPINFDSPYKAFSIKEFWKRWHISLTTFLTKYIYIPLGGNRKGTTRTYINIMLVFLISGIWHGANWTFILWGLLHGLCCIIDRIIEKKDWKIFPVVRWIISFGIVNVLWLLFRSDSIRQWLHIGKQILLFNTLDISDDILGRFTMPELNIITSTLHLSQTGGKVGMLFMVLLAFVICLVPENNYKSQNKNGGGSLTLAIIAFVLSVLCLSTESVFVYFNF